MSHKTRLKSATDAAKEGQKFCKTCKFEISADDSSKIQNRLH